MRDLIQMLERLDRPVDLPADVRVSIWSKVSDGAESVNSQRTVGRAGRPYLAVAAFVAVLAAIGIVAFLQNDIGDSDVGAGTEVASGLESLIVGVDVTASAVDGDAGWAVWTDPQSGLCFGVTAGADVVHRCGRDSRVAVAADGVLVVAGSLRDDTVVVVAELEGGETADVPIVTPGVYALITSDDLVRLLGYDAEGRNTENLSRAALLGEEPVGTSAPIDLEEPVPFRVLAVGPSGRGTTVIDLFEREVVTYHSRVLPVDRTDGAVAAPDGAWITWNNGHAYLFADSLDQVTAELGPSEVRSMEGIAPALRAVPDPGGERVWLVQPGLGYADHDEPTLVQLVSIDGRPPILDLEIDPNAFPVAATASGLVLNTHGWFDTGDGYVTATGTERVLHLRTDGAVETVGSGFAIAAGPDRIARLDCPVDGAGCDPFADTNRLLITDPNGANPVEVEGPFDGVWRSVGGPAIPSDAMPLRSTSPSGLEMLVSISRTVDINATPIDPTLVAVNLDDGTSRAIADIRPGVAAWSSDGRWIVVIFGRDLTLIASDDPDRMIELPGVIPENFWPLAAG